MGDPIEVFPSDEAENRTYGKRATGSPLPNRLYGVTTNTLIADTLITTDATEASSSDYLINATAHSALVGDRILITSGALSGHSSSVIETATNTITLGQRFSSNLGAGVSFEIRRAKFLSCDSSGGMTVSPSYTAGEPLTDGFAVGGGDSSGQFQFFDVNKYSSSLDASGDYLATASALFADFLGTPTTLKADSAGNLKTTEYGPSGLPNFYSNVFGIVEIPLCSVGDPTSALVAGVSGDVTPTGAKNGIQVNGNIAHDAVDDSNAKPIKIGSTASTAAPTAVAVGDRVNLWLDTRGRVSVFSDTLSTEATLTTLSSTASTINGKLTTAAALADSVANPTVGSYGAYNAVWDSTGTRWNRLKGDATAGVYVGGAIAHDGADTGNPVKIGMKSRTALVTAVANADRSDWSGNVVGFGGVTLAHNTRSDTFTTTANGTTLGDGFQNWKYFTLSVRQTGTVTSWTVVLEVSLDNTTFSTVLTHTNVTGSGVVVFAADAIPRPVLYMRARCTAIVLGAGTNVISTIIGVQ